MRVEEQPQQAAQAIDRRQRVLRVGQALDELGVAPLAAQPQLADQAVVAVLRVVDERRAGRHAAPEGGHGARAAGLAEPLVGEHGGPVPVCLA